MRRAGTAYAKYFEQRTEKEKRDPTSVAQNRRTERRVSVISPHSLWLKDGFFWYRVAVSINSALAAMFSASLVACYAKGKTIC